MANESPDLIVTPTGDPEPEEAHFIQLQAQWEEHMKDLSPKRRYSRVSVLLLYWIKAGPSYLDTTQEIEDLTRVFEDRYHFKVLKGVLNPGGDKKKAPQKWLQKYLADFLDEEDEKDALLIVYYAGHGNPGTGGNHSGANVDQVAWAQSEYLMHMADAADILLIFDCCFAGKVLGLCDRRADTTTSNGLARLPGNESNTKSFECLVSTASNDLARLPGKESFSRALIWALNQLADEKDGFTTLCLYGKIIDAPDFRNREQTPMVSQRRSLYLKPLVLAPLDPNDDLPSKVSPVEGQAPDNDTGHERDLEANSSRNDSSRPMALIQPGINTCKGAESDQESILESVVYREDQASNAADRQDSTQLLSINHLAAPTSTPVMPKIPAVPSDSGYGTADLSISGANQKPVSGLEEQVPQHEQRTPSPQTDFGLEKTEPTMSQTGEASLADNASLEHPDAPEEQSNGARDDTGMDDVEDTKSVVSIPDSIGSQISTTTSQPVSAAEKAMSVLLARNTHLVPLHEEALGKMEASRFIDNYRKMLKIFYVGLTQTASTRLEKESIQILRSRNRRITIAENIVNLVESQPEEIPAQPSEDSLRIENHTSFLEEWLAGNKGFTDLRTDVAPDSPDHSEAEPDDPKCQEPPNITRVQVFLMSGAPFRTLLFNFHIFLLPKTVASLTRVLMTLPNDKIWFTEANDNSLLNKFKTAMEEFSGERWDWRPLRPVMHPLQQDQVRINWQCHCNTHLWVEVSKAQAERYKFLLENRPSDRKYTHLCAQRKRKRSSTLRSNTWVLSKRCIQSTQWSLHLRNPSSPSETTQFTGRPTVQSPSGVQSSTHGAPVQLHASAGSSSQGSPPTSQDSTKNSVTSGNAAISLGNSQQGIQGTTPSVRQGLYVLFGVKGARRTLELAQIDAKRHKDDALFFKELRMNYKQLRGFWRRWFSVWRLKHCDFVKFKKIRANRFIFYKNDIPNDPDYEYSPKPPDDVPPITPHEFELALGHCGDQCLLSWLHDCMEPPSELDALHKIPKRSSALHHSTNSPEFAWGIQAQHIPSFLWILMYHSLIIFGTFGFWAWWQINHPSDLQNASTPLSVIVTLLSLFWALSAVPKILREPM